MKELIERIALYNSSHGWRDYIKSFEDADKVIVKLALIITEVSEAIESVRKQDFNNFKEELADIIIRTLDLSDILFIDIEKEIDLKMDKNEKRPYKHGGKVV